MNERDSTSANLRFGWIQTAILIMPFIVAVIWWNQMPPRIATHWGFDGKPNGYMPKAVGSLLLPFVNIGVALLLTYLPRIDPSRELQHDATRALRFVHYAVTGFLSVAACLTVFFAAGYNFPMERVIFVGVDLLFIALGFALPSVPRNYFVGFRLPWTLEDPENWRRTHAFGGPVLTIAGVTALILTFVLDESAAQVVLWCMIGVILVIPTIYSYRLYRQSHRS